MSAMQLSTYAELGLVLFLFAFVLVAIDLARKNKEELEHAEQLPLDDPRPSQERSP
jgi:hypothetical protein